MKKIFFSVSKNALLIFYLIFLSLPLFWVLSLSFKTSMEIYSGIPNLIPIEPTFSNYYAVLFEQNIINSMLNSVKVGIVSSIGVVLISIPASYSLVRYKTYLNNGILAWIIVSQIFPVILIMVPLYIVLRNMGLTDSLIGLSIVYIVWTLPFVLWMMQGYVRAIPFELEEAALIDGASKKQIILKVIMPLLLPGIAASGLFAFITAWNEFFFALVLMKSQDLITLPVDLARYTGMEGQARTGPLAAASIIATIPSLIIFSIMQKWFTSGLVSGAVKE